MRRPTLDLRSENKQVCATEAVVSPKRLAAEELRKKHRAVITGSFGSCNCTSHSSMKKQASSFFVRRRGAAARAEVLAAGAAARRGRSAAARAGKAAPRCNARRPERRLTALVGAAARQPIVSRLDRGDGRMCWRSGG